MKTKNILVITIGIWACTFGYFQEWREGLKPGLLAVNEVLAKETEPALGEELAEELPTYTVTVEDVTPSFIEPVSVEDKIRAVFGKDAEDALKIAKCESQLNPNAHGDKHLTYEKNGKIYGDSHGLFQIRAFDNRPERGLLIDADFNIKYAKKMFDSQGWYPWTCARQVGLINN